MAQKNLFVEVVIGNHTFWEGTLRNSEFAPPPSLTKSFTGMKIHESALYKDFEGVNLMFALKKIFPLTLVYGFENNLSKNQYFFT